MARFDLFRKYRWPVLASLLLLISLLGHVGRYWHWSPITQLDNQLYDYRLNATLSTTIDERIVIVDIDEKSLAEQGRWPWRRDKLATMVNTLFADYQIRQLGFDIVFAEPDDSAGLSTLNMLATGPLQADAAYQAEWAKLQTSLNVDQRFALSLKNRPVVLGYYFNFDDHRGSGKLPAAPLSVDDLRQPLSIYAQGFGANLPILANAAPTAGHFNPIADPDGVMRRAPLLVPYQGALYEALSLAMFRQLQGTPPISLIIPDALGSTNHIVEKLAIGAARMPVDEDLQSYIPFRGKRGAFRYISATDILHHRVPLASLAHKIVIMGTTAPGLMDLRSAPFSSVYPGVEMHANMLSGMLDGRIPEAPAYFVGAEMVALLCVFIVLLTILLRASPLQAILATVLSLSLVIISNVALWKYAHMAFPLACSVLLIIGLFVIEISYGYFFEARRKRQLTSLFGQYAPPELVGQMANDPEKYTMEGQNRELTVLFSDVRNFTQLSEGMEPKQLTQLMNAFLTELSTVIRQRHLGTIDKYMGDCIMAFWGAPYADPDHAISALSASLDMQAAIAQLNPKLIAQGMPSLSIGIGINTGKMTVGDMGSQFRMAYTVMGDAVNVASRLESASKLYGVGIIVGESTREAARQGFIFRELDRIRVKGKDDALTIFELVCRADALSSDQKSQLQCYQQALRYYRDQNWDLAELQFLNLQKSEPASVLYALYLARIQAFRLTPPPENWGGITTLESK